MLRSSRRKSVSMFRRIASANDFSLRFASDARVAQPDAKPRAAAADVHASVGSIEKAEWDRLFPGDVEGYDLYRVFDSVPPPGFRLGALTLSEGGRLAAAAPLFETAYRLDTPLQGAARRVSNWVCARAPGLTQLKVLGIGSPLSDNCGLGFAPEADIDGRRKALGTLLDRLAEEAVSRKAAIMAVKSLGSEAEQLHDVLEARGYGRVTSVPVVMLPLPFASLEHYLASLPSKNGGYLKRKMRAAANLRIEYRAAAAGIEHQLNELYASTLAQSAVDYGDFEGQHSAYFPRLLEGLGDRARLMLCWRGAELLSFQVFLVGEKRIIANKIGMKYPEAREYNLYFVNWIEMIRFAIERGIPEIEMGATSYAAKLLFGGHIDRRWRYFRFRGAVANRLARPLAPLFDFERNDPELTRIAAGQGKIAAR